MFLQYQKSTVIIDVTIVSYHFLIINTLILKSDIRTVIVT